MELEKLRHSCSHVLAAAVKELFPNVKLGIGPAIDDGFYYDFYRKEPFTPEDLKKIEKKMQEIINRDEKFIKTEASKKEAEDILKDEPYKLELLKDIDKPTFYQSGKFKDLCSGPHVNSTKEIKAFKLLRVSGAYWKGDSKNKQLQRIYGTAFNSKKDLDKYINLLEEAEKRNHIKLGKKLRLFTFEKESPGSAFFLPNGTIMYNELMKFTREEYKKRDYKEIKTPVIFNNSLWKTSGHWEHYKKDMFLTKVENHDYALKPMNCPAAMILYKNELHSYKELPLRYADFGVLHRNELSGVLNGLFRLRYFVQDDAHIFLTEDQVEKEIIDLIDFISYVYKKVFNFDYTVELSTRPEKFLGEKELWDKSEKALENALKNKKVKYIISSGEGVFYGPKIDFHVKDALGRTWQLSTIQLDFSMPERFDMTYEGKDGKKHRPVVIHRAIFGAFERFLGVLTEHYAGKFPLWLSPIQVILMTVKDDDIKYAEGLMEELKENNIRVELDKRVESIGKKVRDAQVKYVPLMITVGQKERETNELAVRNLDGKVSIIDRKIFIKSTKEKIEKRKL